MKPKWWFALAAVLTAIAVIVAVNLFVFSGTSAASYVDNEFERVQTSQYDNKDVRTYRSDKKPTEVAALIVDKWQPQSQYADGSGIYLRYPDDAIVIKPKQSGSQILVMDDERAYGLFYAHIGGIWGWTSTHGGSFRGRGPGAGK